MRGPAGAGKTATLKVVAKEMGFQVQEWEGHQEVSSFNPFDNDFDTRDNVVPYEGQIKAFFNFINRANKYQTLTGLTSSSSEMLVKGHKLVLLDEIPSFLRRNSQNFQSLLHSYVTKHAKHPLVIILSDSNKDEQQNRNILPKEDILNTLGVAIITFNSATTTNLVKTLKTIATLESANGPKRFSVPDKDALTALAEASGGDIRGAINALQFACQKGGASTSQADFKSCFNGSTMLSSKKKKTKHDKRKGPDIDLAKIGGRDTSLDMFHAIGKVLYCKRSTDSLEEFPVPENKVSLKRSPLMSNPEEILLTSPLSEDSLTCFLHQSYTSFFGKIDDLANAADQLSFADGFFNEWLVKHFSRSWTH